MNTKEEQKRESSKLIISLQSKVERRDKKIVDLESKLFELIDVQVILNDSKIKAKTIIDLENKINQLGGVIIDMEDQKRKDDSKLEILMKKSIDREMIM
mgnify:FL=1|tara:strand:+ start:124 stop:420 length:297 start_codon:yes stop_codon:yes gene_type:complete